MRPQATVLWVTMSRADDCWSQACSLCANHPHVVCKCQIRAEGTADSDLVVFSEDVFLSLADIAAAEGAGLLQSQQNPQGRAVGTQRPQQQQQQQQQQQHRKGRSSKTRVAPLVGALSGGPECERSIHAYVSSRVVLLFMSLFGKPTAFIRREIECLT